MPKQPKVVATVRLSPELLERVDAVAEARGDSRSDVLERMIRNDIENEEQFVRVMENPITRAILGKLGSSPKLMATIAAMVGEEFSDEDAERVMRNSAKQVERGRQRAAAKKQAGASSSPQGA